MFNSKAMADLKELLTEKIEGNTRMFNQRITDMQTLHNSQVEAAKDAIKKAAEDIERTRLNQNEWRGTISDRDKMLATKTEVDAVEKIVAALSSRMDRNEGKGTGVSSFVVIFISVIVAAAAVVSAAVIIFKK